MKAKKVPMRMCIGCKEMKPKKELLRLVTPKEGSIIADPTGKANGRGCYICRDSACVEKASKNKNYRLPQDVVQDIMQELEQGE